jgi:translation initiation factor 1
MTVVTGVVNAREREDLAKKLRCLCACGGSVKGDEILLQGDHRNRVANFLLENGYSKEKIETF